MLTGPGPRVSKAGLVVGLGFQLCAVGCLSRLFCFPRPAIFQIIQSIRMGMWASPGGLTPPPPAGGWTTSALSRVSVGSQQVTQKRKKQTKNQRLPQLFPDHFIVDVRPNCFLTGHLGISVFLSGKDILLCSWQDGELCGVCSSAVCLDSPWVSLMSACGPPMITALLSMETVSAPLGIAFTNKCLCSTLCPVRLSVRKGVKIAPQGNG